MLTGSLFSVLAASALAAFRVALPQVSVGAPQARVAVVPAAPVAAVAAALPQPVMPAVAAAPALTTLPNIPQATAALPQPAQAAAPALAGKVAWTGLFDGAAKPAGVNTVLDARTAPVRESWEASYRLYAEVRGLQEELSAIHQDERSGKTGLAGRKRHLWNTLVSADERLSGPADGDFKKASLRLKEAHAAQAAARAELYAAMRSQAPAAAVAAASGEVRRAEAEAVAAGLRAARLLLEGRAKVHSKETRRNAAVTTLAAAAEAANNLHAEVAYGGARTLRAAAARVEVPTRRWVNAPGAAGPEKVQVVGVNVYPDRPTAVRAQEHQAESIAAEQAVVDRRASETSFWIELMQQAGAEGADARPLVPAEAAAFVSFAKDAAAWAGRGAVPAKREAAARINEAADAAAAGRFADAAKSLASAQEALDGRAAELARMRAAVTRRAETLSAGGRHEALLEAAARWRRLLKRPLDARRAADLAGEARNHREAYLSQDEPGLPGYARARKALERLEAALTSLSRADARALVDRFEEDLVHRRSLRITVVLLTAKDGGTARSSDRFALPGTTMRTLLKRVGGIPEKPEVRVNGGAWTAYSDLKPREKLTDETVVEILLPPAGVNSR